MRPGRGTPESFRPSCARIGLGEAIRERREPNASLHQVLAHHRTLHKLEKQLVTQR